MNQGRGNGGCQRVALQVITPTVCKVGGALWVVAGRRWPRGSTKVRKGVSLPSPSIVALYDRRDVRGRGKEVTAGIPERCHFSFVFCQGLLTSARWVTGINPSWDEGWVSSAEVDAAPVH